MKKRLIVLLAMWLLTTALFVACSEDILDMLLPNVHGVEQWLALLMYGVLGLFVSFVVALIVLWSRYRNRKSN
jgi:hypothetical protein